MSNSNVLKIVELLRYFGSNISDTNICLFIDFFCLRNSFISDYRLI